MSSLGDRSVYLEQLHIEFERIATVLQGGDGVHGVQRLSPAQWRSLRDRVSVDAWVGNDLLYGRMMVSVQEAIPSVASLLLMPRDEIQYPLLAALQTFGQENTTFILYDLYPLGQEAPLSVPTPGLAPHPVPSSMAAAVGPQAWMWRGLSFADATPTLEALSIVVTTWLEGLGRAPKVADEVAEARAQRRRSYLGLLAGREGRARDNLRIMLGEQSLIDPFLHAFYFPTDL